ncbi:MAG: thioredoxin, partial [Actinobacteria bacterium]|nr:thioredoxin [Actinomycetota bacterium]MBT5505367.1 thioredoxin [Actinomycetota bacterium]MBT7379796.1 thioredoxin [Actinomycetota bacterium]
VSSRMVMGIDAMLVLSPEHLSRFVDAGWDRSRFLTELSELLVIDADDIIVGAHGIDEGIPTGFAGLQLPKFRPDGLLVVHAGGAAGLFSAIIGGWVNGNTGSDPVTKEIQL